MNRLLAAGLSPDTRLSDGRSAVELFFLAEGEASLQTRTVTISLNLNWTGRKRSKQDSPWSVIGFFPAGKARLPPLAAYPSYAPNGG